MEQFVVTGFADFVQQTESFDLVGDCVLFRGQHPQGNLLPGIARHDPSFDTTKHEKMVLEQLQLQGSTMLAGFGKQPLDVMIAAQHFGLKTRLLDWTSNPLAALFFACNDRKAGDVFVYAMVADKLLAKDVYARNPFERQQTLVFQPRLNNPRIIAQHGWFTLHCFSNKMKCFLPLEKNAKHAATLIEYRIEGDKREEIIGNLDRYGVSAKTLFPDLEGLCKYLNWRHPPPDNSPAL